MIFTDNQALELIKAPVNGALISLCREHEERLEMHTEPILEHSNMSQAFYNFKGWVSSFLPPDKFKRFEQLLTLPLETVDSTEAIFDELSKVFGAPDGYTTTDFTSPVIEQDFNNYMSNVVEFENFWEVRGFQALKNGINSFVVCDLPANQTTLRPEPYFYILSIKNVRDVEINPLNGNVEYLAFWQKDKSIILLDDGYFRKFAQPNDQSDWVQVFAKPHGLNYVPACSLYRDSISRTKGTNKRSPLTSSLSKLDWLLFWRVSQRYFNLYGAYPITVTYKEQCKYRDSDGNECMEGFINYQETLSTADGLGATVINRQRKCPACEQRGLVGAGSHVKVEAPRDKDEANLMDSPVKFIEVSNDKLEYGVKETMRLEREIFLNSAGFYHEATKDAINEKQVESQFESRKGILDRIREQLEYAKKFTLETTARLRYGSYFRQATVYMGRDYFLQTSTDLMLKYKAAKEAGLPAYELSRIRDSYTKTTFKNNIKHYERVSILSQIEPFADLTIQELIDTQMNIIFPDLFALKLDFASFVSKFERENTNVVEFGSLIPLKDKINIITKKLLQYVSERNPKPLPSPQNDGSTTGRP